MSDILAENESLRLGLNIKPLLLICFALPAAISASITFNMSPDYSFLQVFNEWVRIAVSYILAIAFMIFLPKYIVKAARIAAIIVLLATLTMLLPLSPLQMTAAYCFQNLCSLFVMAIGLGVVVNLFSKAAAIKLMCLIYVFAALLIVVLNDKLPISFTSFKVWSAISAVFWLFFWQKMPIAAWPIYLSESDGIELPRMLFAGVYCLLIFSIIFTSLGAAVIMSVVDGFPTSYQAYRSYLPYLPYLSSIPAAIAIYTLNKRMRINPFKIGAVLVALGTIGIAGIILSTYVPALAISACILIGASGITLGLVTYYGGVLLAERYPSKFIAPLMLVFSFSSLAVYSLLRTVLEDNVQFLYAACLLIAIILTVLYLIISSYISYARIDEDIPIVLSDKANNLSENAFDKLAGQELRLAELIMQGYTHKEITDMLKISDNTARGYRKSLYSKLQIHSRKELFDLAEKNGNGK